MNRKILIAVILFGLAAAYLLTRPQEPRIVDNGYSHDKFVTMPVDVRRQFAAFEVSFDSADDDDGDSKDDARGIPEWVAYDLKRFEGPCVPTTERPRWFSDEELVAEGVAPKDDSYTMSAADREKDGYDRGHMMPKFLAARLGEQAERNTHTLLNAVPQRHEFNAGIWLDLERLTGAWAQHYGEIWVVTGPIFKNRRPTRHLGETGKGEFPVAIPDALYKIVLRRSGDPDRPHALAFVYPQEGEGYARGPYDHPRHLVSIDEIEKATALDFLTLLPDGTEAEIEGARASALWPVTGEDFLRECKKQQ